MKNEGREVRLFWPGNLVECWVFFSVSSTQGVRGAQKSRLVY